MNKTKIATTGSSGLIGPALLDAAPRHGWDVVRAVRNEREARGDDAFFWNPAAGKLAPDDLEGFGAILHLAGESVARGAWTPEKRAAIRDSRVKGTALLCETMAKLRRPPDVFLLASSAGHYGNREGDEWLDESAPAGKGFLADVAKDAEEIAAAACAKLGVRWAALRFGIVVAPSGGALGKRFENESVAGAPPDGIWRSWIALKEIPCCIDHILKTPELSGPINIASPEALQNRQFAGSISAALGSKTIFDIPAEEARARFGEMADELILRSGRIKPKKLLDSGYNFRYLCLPDALSFMLSEKK